MESGEVPLVLIEGLLTLCVGPANLTIMML